VLKPLSFRALFEPETQFPCGLYYCCFFETKFNLSGKERSPPGLSPIGALGCDTEFALSPLFSFVSAYANFAFD
jgi:hypothetical protein